MRGPACDRCKRLILKGQFYIEVRKRTDNAFIPARHGVDTGLNLDPITYMHIPSCEVYA